MKKLLTLGLVLVVLAVHASPSVAQSAALPVQIPLTDPSTGDQIPPSVLAVNPTTKRVYVGGRARPSGQALLAVIDGTTNTVTTTIPLIDPRTGEPLIIPSVLGVNPTTNTIYVGGYTSSVQQVVLVINGARNTVTTAIPLTDPSTGEQIDPSILAVNPTTKKVYVGGYTSSGRSLLAVINGTTNSLTATIPLNDPATGDRIDPSLLAVSPTPNTVYVGGYSWSGQALLAVINGTGVSTTIPLKDPSTGNRINPSSLGVNPTTKRVYVSGRVFSPSVESVVAVINGTTNTLTTMIPLKDPSTAEPINSPSLLGVTPTTNTIHVGGLTPSNQRVLAVINGATNSVTSTVALTDPSTGSRIDPIALGVNPTTKRVYVGGEVWGTGQPVVLVIQQ